jgi:hypothetical protein
MEAVTMEAVAFTLISARKEALVSELAEFRPFDLQALSPSYSERRYQSRPSHREESLVTQAS